MRKILVPVKRVIDPYVKPRVKADHSGVETTLVKMSMNPFDEIAVEEAVRLKEKNQIDEIILVSIGDDKCQETLRQGLALGADRAILILSNDTSSACVSLEPLNIAKILQKIVQDENPLCVMMGKQTIDGDHNQTGQMLAALLDWPQATFASKIEMDSDRHCISVTREIDGGLQTILCSLPAVITTDLRLNEPRYASLPNIMKAKSKSLSIISLTDLGLSLTQHTHIVSVTEPSVRTGGEIVSDVQTLVAKLKNEARVL